MLYPKVTYLMLYCYYYLYWPATSTAFLRLLLLIKLFRLKMERHDREQSVTNRGLLYLCSKSLIKVRV